MMDEKLDALVARRDELATLMSAGDGGGADDYVRLSKEYAELTPVVECIEEQRAIEAEIDDLEASRTA
jgi:peptide chain release factor 1